MSCVVVYGFYLRECSEMICFRVELYSLFGRRRGIAVNISVVENIAGERPYLPQADTVLYQPFVNGFGWMGHEDPPSKVRLGKYVWQGRCMV